MSPHGVGDSPAGKHPDMPRCARVAFGFGVAEHDRSQFAASGAVESPWVLWRLGLLDSDQVVVGSFGSVVRRLELCWG